MCACVYEALRVFANSLSLGLRKHRYILVFFLLSLSFPREISDNKNLIISAILSAIELSLVFTTGIIIIIIIIMIYLI